jgi:hypothetical protein
MVDLLKIAALLAGIIVLIRIKVALSITLMVSALVLALLFRLSVGEVLDGAGRAFLSLENLKLVTALELVLLFSAVLKYYEAGMGKTYRLLLMPTAVVFLTGVGVFAAAEWLTG